jgi:hypothetical protein
VRRDAARGRYVAGARCVAQALADNTFCHNRTRDLQVTGDAARWGGVRNRCARAEGWSEAGPPGLHRGLRRRADARARGARPALAAARPPPDARACARRPRPRPTTARDARACPRAAPSAPASTDGGNGPLWVMGGFVAMLVAAGLLTRKR